MNNCFDFRIVKKDDGTEIFDPTCVTPYNALTPVQMQEYIEADNQISFMKCMKRREQREQKKQKKYQRNPLYKLAVLCELL